jgi:hypothetical protein
VFIKQQDLQQFKQPYETCYFWTTYSFSKLAAQEKEKKEFKKYVDKSTTHANNSSTLEATWTLSLHYL